MKKWYLSWILAVVYGCGSLGSNKEGGKKNEGKKTQENAPQPSSVITNPNPLAQGASIIDKLANLPPCVAGNEGQLIFVSETKDFRACTRGQWSTIDLKGEKGEAGKDADYTDSMKAGFNLYNNYRQSIFRIMTNCQRLNPEPASCVSTPNTGARIAQVGTAFLCEKNTVCTNRHVAFCPEDCYKFESLSIQSTKANSNSINADGSPLDPFFTVQSTTSFKKHASYDLVKFPISGAPTDAKVLPIAKDRFTQNTNILAPILAISFTLGFQDLYADLGEVNATYIGECDDEGGLTGYGCLRKEIDFATTNDTDHGSSGSPLFDIRSGLVVGVTTAGTDQENANITWAIDASRLNEINQP